MEVRSSFQKVYDRTTASFDACLQELLDETRASMQEAQASAAVAGDEARAAIREAAVALTEVRRKFHEVYDRVSTSFENATVALLELHEESYGRLQQTQVGTVAEMVRQVADHEARQGDLLSTVVRAQERPGGGHGELRVGAEEPGRAERGPAPGLRDGNDGEPGSR